MQGHSIGDCICLTSEAFNLPENNLLEVTLLSKLTLERLLTHFI